MNRSITLLAVVLALFAAGCAKDLPSSPGAPAGTPVLLTGIPNENNSRQVSITSGKIKNQSGLTIYQVQVGVQVYRDDPVFATIDTIFDVNIDSLHNGDEASFVVQWFFADKFLNAYPVYSFVPANP